MKIVLPFLIICFLALGMFHILKTESPTDPIDTEPDREPGPIPGTDQQKQRERLERTRRERLEKQRKKDLQEWWKYKKTLDDLNDPQKRWENLVATQGKLGYKPLTVGESRNWLDKNPDITADISGEFHGHNFIIAKDQNGKPRVLVKH